MGQIGNFGKSIIFSTSDSRILNFRDFQQTISGRWASHDRILQKPKSEFLGPDNRKITFKIDLNALHGVKPRRTMEIMEKIVENGTVESLVIGGKKVGKHKWKMISISEAWDIILDKGEVVKASVSVTLEEYV